MKKLLIVGQAPGPNTDPELPLFPATFNSTGSRLAVLMKLSREDYLARTDRVNLLQFFPGRNRCADKFPMKLATVAAQAMLPFLAGRTVVFLGRSVAKAFGYPSNTLDFFEWNFAPKWQFKMACVPHMSGRCRWYNDLTNIRTAERFWSEALAHQFQPK